MATKVEQRKPLVPPEQLTGLAGEAQKMLEESLEASNIPQTTKQELLNKGTPALKKEGGVAQEVKEKLPEWEKPALKVLLNGILLLAGMVLIIAGIFTAVGKKPPMMMPVPV